MATEDSYLKKIPGQTRGERLKEAVINFFPILTWCRVYTLRDCVADAIAGITVGLTVVPQSIAYAAIAGLSPQYGLYSAYLGPLIYFALGSCRQINIGPTAVMGLLTQETCGANFPECAILASLWAGIFQIVFAALRFGFIINFISEPVTVGFTFSAAVIILSSQLGNLLGIKGDKGNSFLDYCSFLYNGVDGISINDVILGFSSLLILLLLKKLGTMSTDTDMEFSKLTANVLWFVSTSKNAVVVILSALLAFLWPTPIFSLTGLVPGGLPELKPPGLHLPAFSANNTFNNSQTGAYLSFAETWNVLGTGPLVIALISIMQNVAIAKTFQQKKPVNIGQEMIALGAANIGGSFLSAIPVSGSFSRSAVNNASGVRSPAGGLLTGIIVMLSLTFLTPTFYYIPKASLAAVIISAVIFMGDFAALAAMWKVYRVDLAICGITFLCCLLLGMEYGILIGVGISLFLLLLKTLKPNLYYEVKTDTETGIQYLYVEPHESVHFSSVAYLRNSMRELLARYNHVPVLVLNFEKWSHWDYTTAITFQSLHQDAITLGKEMVMQGCSHEWALALQHAGLKNLECFKDSYFDKCVQKLRLPTLNVQLSSAREREEIL